MKKSKGKKNSGLGKGIIRATSKKRYQKAPENHEYLNWHPPTDQEEKPKNLNSITQLGDLAELAMQAELADTSFAAEKQNVVILSSTSFKAILEPTKEQLALQYKHFNDLTIPRRPPWNENTTAVELDQNERKTFLEWRRKLAELEQNEQLVLTPFEKNIEVWRQLWRAVERSDVVVQIVDGRNPMIRCTDLEKYVKEVDPKKQNLLLVNKADLLTKNQRICWARYFSKHNVRFLFWSANFEKIKLEEKLERQEQLKKEMEEEERKGENEEEDGEGEETVENEPKETESTESPSVAVPEKQEKEEPVKEKEEAEKPKEEGEKEKEEKETKGEENKQEDKKEETQSETKAELSEEELLELARVRNTDEFLDEIRKIRDAMGIKLDGQKKYFTVGMVGYPNVGKSSTINVLCGEKKVSVSLTPGKTKHLQTIKLTEDIMLCDCPGLVFPSFLTTKPEMLCSGLLPIDHMRDHRGPVALVCNRIPRSILEWMYGIAIPLPGEGEDSKRDPTPEELLQAYGKIRGFMTSHGVPNESRAARLILKDYLTGKLLYAHPPPDNDPQWKQWYEDEEAEHFGLTAKDIKNDEVQIAQRQKRIKASPIGLDELSFAAQSNVQAHTTGHKGKGKGVTNFRRVEFKHSPIPTKPRGGPARGRGGLSRGGGRGGGI